MLQEKNKEKDFGIYDECFLCQMQFSIFYYLAHLMPMLELYEWMLYKYLVIFLFKIFSLFLKVGDLD